MLNKLRTHHIKRILWGLVVIIVPAFVMWGGASFLKEKQDQTIATMGKNKISFTQFNYYVKMAQMQTALSGDRASMKISTEDINKLAWEYLLLLWKVNKEKVQASDKEVMDEIGRIFSVDGKFSKNTYERILQRSLATNARNFEDFIRNTIRIRKLFEKFANGAVDEKELRDAYFKDNQIVKIGYAMVSYQSLNDKVSVNDKDAEDYYAKNKDSFKEPPKIKIKYAVIKNDNPAKDAQLTAAKGVKSIADLKDLEVKESSFISANETIPGIGFQTDVNKAAFELGLNVVSSPLPIKDGFVIIEKIAEQPTRISEFDEVKNKIIAKLKSEKTNNEAKKIVDDLLKKINDSGIKDLQQFAKDEKLEYKETNDFRRSEFIEVLGFDQKVKDEIFSLKKDDIYKSAVISPSGVSIMQLKSISEFDEKDFTAKKETYSTYLKYQRELTARMEFMANITKESGLKIKELKK